MHFSDLGRGSAKLVPRRQYIGVRHKAIGQFSKASTPSGQGATWPVFGFGSFFDTETRMPRGPTAANQLGSIQASGPAEIYLIAAWIPKESS